MDLAHDKIVSVPLPGSGSRGLVVQVVLIQVTDQKACIAIHDHSRSSIMMRAKSVCTRSPFGGISANRLSNPAFMLFAPGSTRVSSNTLPRLFLIRIDSPGARFSSGVPRRKSRPVRCFFFISADTICQHFVNRQAIRGATD